MLTRLILIYEKEVRKMLRKAEEHSRPKEIQLDVRH